MRHTSRFIGRAVFGAAALAALGFGTAQAFAEPAGVAARRACNQKFCNDYCVGLEYAGGTCSGVGGHACLCY